MASKFKPQLFSSFKVLYDAVDQFSTPIRTLYGRLFGEVNKEILDQLPLFVTRTVREVLFGYSDETTEQIPRIREIFGRYGVELKVDEYIQDGQFALIKSVSLNL